MPFIPDGRTLIQRAYERNYAMPAFNVFTFEMARACVEAAEAERAPIILQTYPGDLDQIPARQAYAIVKSLAEEATVPIMLHLDHGESFEMASSCLRAGYSSVMFDGADYSLEENIQRTQELAKFTDAVGASLEVTADSFEDGDGITDPEAAARLLHKGNATKVAVAVGSKHGQASHLDIKHLETIAQAVRAPLVLHGGSGIPAEDLAEAVKLGVTKVNIGAALYRPVMRLWSESPAKEDHYQVLKAIREELFEVARNKISIMKASRQAP